MKVTPVKPGSRLQGPKAKITVTITREQPLADLVSYLDEDYLDEDGTVHSDPKNTEELVEFIKEIMERVGSDPAALVGDMQWHSVFSYDKRTAVDVELDVEVVNEAD